MEVLIIMACLAFLLFTEAGQAFLLLCLWLACATLWVVMWIALAAIGITAIAGAI